MMLFGMPVDFILFALTLPGFALFHRRTLRVALTGLTTIVVEKLPAASWPTAFGLGFLSAVFDNIPLTALRSNKAAMTGVFSPSPLGLAVP